MARPAKLIRPINPSSGPTHRTRVRRHTSQQAVELGPNGGKVEYLPNGDKVEWIIEADKAGKKERWPLLLRRNDRDVSAAHDEYWVKVNYLRHRELMNRMRKSDPRLHKQEAAAVREYENKYGKENLPGTRYEEALCEGRLSALSWVLGLRWEESMDI